MLRQSLIDREHADKSAASIVAKWEQGDEDGLAQLLLTNPAHPEFAPLVEKLVFERNEKMAQHLESILQTPGTRFVIVGVLHVVGNRGVPAILARDGYEVSPILGPAAAAANDSGLAWMMSR
jgi:uncharacterized protein YbaP (TraB family)